jgi:hypothetical protein
MAAEGEGSNGGGGYATTVRPERERPATDTTSHAGAASPSAHARAYDYALTYAHARAYVSLAMKASGLLALLLSTVVLLGGYVQSLGKKEFFCITVISAIQAAGSVISSLYFCLSSLFSPSILLPRDSQNYPPAYGFLR